MSKDKFTVAGLALAAVISLAAGCNTTTPGSTPVTTSSAALTAEKAMVDVEATFYAAVTAAQSAEASGLVDPITKTKIDGLITQAYVALKVARAAYSAGTAPDVTTVVNLVAQIAALTPLKN